MWKKIGISLCIGSLAIVIALLILHNTGNKIKIPVSVANYTVTSIDGGVEKILGNLQIKYEISNKGIIIIETRTYEGHFFSSENIIDVVINEKKYLFDGDFNLYDVTEKEVVNDEDNFFARFQVHPLTDHIVVAVTFSNAPLDSVYLPKSEIPISSYSSGQYSIANSKMDKIGSFFFFYNTHSYFDRYRYVRTEDIEIDMFGIVNAHVVEHVGNIDSTLWIDDRGLILQKEELLEDDFILRIELESIVPEYP